MSRSSEPLVLVPACHRRLGHHVFHIAGQKYTDAVRLAGCMPLVVPSAVPDEFDALLDLADGVLLTGSPSNVEPVHFGEAVHDPAAPLDPRRDAWILPLIPRILARGIPLLAICRGMQELNVALGGSLDQAVHLRGGIDHRADDAAPVEAQYGIAHTIALAPGGVLAGILRCDALAVNSVHAQGLHRLAPGLRAEAHAPDGLVEAVSVPDAAGFALGVQWHPEWQASANPASVRLFAAFGDACRARRALRSPALSETLPHEHERPNA